ncbi:hypothetical protein D3C85_1235780 [compost metagenome]|jgi:catalase
MAKTPKASAPSPTALDAARAAARNIDSGPAHAPPPAAGKGDTPAQKAIDTQMLAASMPVNTNKPR